MAATLTPLRCPRQGCRSPEIMVEEIAYARGVVRERFTCLSCGHQSLPMEPREQRLAPRRGRPWEHGPAPWAT